MNPEKKKYEFINYLKVFAAFSVTAVHFRNRVEPLIPEITIDSVAKLFFSLDYAVFISAVPLFLLVTGFLSINRKPNKKHYIQVIKSYALYLFIAPIMYYVMVYFNARDLVPFSEVLLRLFQFDLISGWYVELFISMSILIPFFNMMFNNMSKRQHQYFIIALVCSISIPAFVNDNEILKEYIYLPNFISNMYPFVYYSIGNYIRKYNEEITVNNKKLVSIILLCITLITSLLFFAEGGYTRPVDGYYPSIIQVILATSIFLLFRNVFSRGNKVIDYVSKYTLGIYIASLPVDRILYPLLESLVGSGYGLIKFSPFIVIVAFMLAVILGVVLTIVFEFLWRTFESLFENRNKKIYD